MERKDYYEILGLKPDANPHQLKETYRKLALLYHPDKNPGDPNAISRMKDINEAYAVLSDPSKRREYDALRNLYGPSAYGRFRQGRTEKDIFKGSDVGEVFEEICRNFGFRGAEDVFREFYGPGVRGPFAGARGLDRSNVFFRFGLWNLFGSIKQERGRDISDIILISPWLALRGGKVHYRHKARKKTLIVTIPPGVKQGQKIRLKGMGATGKNGGVPGDLMITLRVGSSPLNAMKELLKAAWGLVRSAKYYLERLLRH
jgi:curved DNA-binding protein